MTKTTSTPMYEFGYPSPLEDNPPGELPKNILSREEFIRIMNAMRDRSGVYSKLNDALDRLSPSTAPVNFFPNIDHETLFLDVIHVMFNIDRDESIIDYFCYDLDFGRNYNPGDVVDSSGREIPISNAGKLYDYLIDTYFIDEYASTPVQDKNVEQ